VAVWTVTPEKEVEEWGLCWWIPRCGVVNEHALGVLLD
jgi:hypothetical protein